MAAERVWFLVLPKSGLLSLANPWEILAHTNEVLGYPAYELSLFGPRAPAIEMSHGITLAGLRPLPRAPARLPHIAIVAGSPRSFPDPKTEGELTRWLKKYHRRIPTVVSICTGAFVLAALREQFPQVRVVDDGIFVRDGDVWTSAGLTAGVDLTLALVQEKHGHAVAMAVARRMVLFLRRSGKQAQFSAALARQAKEPARLQELDHFVLEHLAEALPVTRLAAGLGMSVRTLTRWCREHLAESPAEVVRRMRLEASQRLLEETELPLKDIAARTGLGDPSTLWRVFSQQLGVTPAEYRARFATECG